MILTCPSCGTQYVVKDGTILPEGRQVRCAACKHSWHQNPEETDQATAGGAVEPQPTEPAAEPGAVEQPETPEAAQGASDDDDESLAEATSIEPRSGPEAEERAYEEAVIDGAAEPEGGAPSSAQDWREPPEAEPVPDMFSPFAED